MQGRKCGRALHAAPQGVDAVPVCLMHSKDPAKHESPLYVRFYLEFKSILTDASQGTADFTRFVVPHLRLGSSGVEPHCVFTEAVFEEDINFYNVVFKRGVEFTGASFAGSFRCDQTTFEGEADFQYVTFGGHASFGETVFMKQTQFFGSRFAEAGIFTKATFYGLADFGGVEFGAQTNFSGATFKGTGLFQNSSIHSAAFLDTTFEDIADFSEVSFAHESVFPRTRFLGEVDFTGAGFGGETVFLASQISRRCLFIAARFLSSVSFRYTKFRDDDLLEPGPVFTLAQFPSDGKAEFYRTNLSHALFHNCDITNVVFSSVIWRKRPGTQNLMVFEEDIPLDHEQASTLRLEDGSRDYGLIAQLYQQLKKNCDDRLDYWAADHFHFGEMEMQRLAVPTTGPLLGLRQFYHRNLSLVAWYRRGSSYGNAYVRPAVWLLVVLVVFSLLFPLTGLQKASPNSIAPAPAPLTYRSVWAAQSSLHDKVWAGAKLVGKSALVTLDTATFQRSPEYTPAYPYGRVLAIVETLLTATLLALFLLAVRRQFRR